MATPKKASRTTQKRPGDATGNAIAAAAETHRKMQEEEAQREATQQRQEEHDLQNTVRDWSDPAHPQVMPLADRPMELDAGGGVLLATHEDEEVPSVEARTPMVVIQVYESVKFIYGMGNEYDLEAGRNESVPAYIADHLAEKGWLAFRSA